MELQDDKESFNSKRECNEFFIQLKDKISRDFGLCENIEDLEQLWRDYKKEIEQIRRFDEMTETDIDLSRYGLIINYFAELKLIIEEKEKLKC